VTERELADLRRMTDKQIRRAQNLVRLQQPLAYRQRNTRALEKLAEWERDYANEMFRRHFATTTIDRLTNEEN
jgi:hypothetical protein